MQQYLQNKKGLVKKVFNKVYNKYDLMNDLMSFGVHRIWKRDLIQFMNPSKNKRLIDSSHLLSGNATIDNYFRTCHP